MLRIGFVVLFWGLCGLACEEPSSQPIRDEPTAASSERTFEASPGEVTPAVRSVGSSGELSSLEEATANRLIREIRAKRNNEVDALYGDYGKGEWRKLGEKVVEHTVEETSKTLTQGASQAEKILVDEMLGLVDEAADNAIADLERDVFQTYIVEVGEGKRSSALDDHTRQFFSNPDIQRRCRDVAALGDQIRELERIIMENKLRQRR